MSDDNDKKTDAEDGEGEGAAKKKMSPIKLAIFAGVPVLVILLGLGAYFMLFSGGGEEEAAAEHGGGGHGEEHADAAHAVDPAHVMFYDLPEVLVNLSDDGKGSNFLKLQVALELPADTDAHVLEPVMPRIVDKFQVFLRELRLEDLSGSAGTYRLKQELLRRVRLSGVDVEVHDVLIRDMIIQ